MQKIVVSIHALLGLLHIAAKKDPRSFLNAVLLEFIGEGQIRYVATNGVILGIYQINSPTDLFEGSISPDGIEPILIPRHVIEMVKHSAKVPWIEMQIGSPELVTLPNEKEILLRKCAFLYQDASIEFKELENDFPDYMSIIPQSFSGKPAQFDPVFLIKIQKAVKIMTKNNDISAAVIAHNGEFGSGFSFGDQVPFFGVIMPSKYGDFFYPEWIQRESAARLLEKSTEKLMELQQQVAAGKVKQEVFNEFLRDVEIARSVVAKYPWHDKRQLRLVA